MTQVDLFFPSCTQTPALSPSALPKKSRWLN